MSRTPQPFDEWAAGAARLVAERNERQAPQMQYPTKENLPVNLDVEAGTVRGGFSPGMTFNQTIQYRPPNAPWYVTYRKDWENVGFASYALASIRLFDNELDALRHAVELGYGVAEWRPGQTLLAAIEAKESAE